MTSLKIVDRPKVRGTMQMWFAHLLLHRNGALRRSRGAYHVLYGSAQLGGVGVLFDLLGLVVLHWSGSRACTDLDAPRLKLLGQFANQVDA